MGYTDYNGYLFQKRQDQTPTATEELNNALLRQHALHRGGGAAYPNMGYWYNRKSGKYMYNTQAVPFWEFYGGYVMPNAKVTIYYKTVNSYIGTGPLEGSGPDDFVPYGTGKRPVVEYGPQSTGDITFLENYHGVNYYLVNGMSGAATVPEVGVLISKDWYDKRLKNDPVYFKALKQHEYGHILQYKANGSELYWGVFAPLSLISASLSTLGLGNHDHNYYFIEVDANYRANHFFGNDASTLFGTPSFPTTVRDNNDFLLFSKIQIKF